MALGAILGAAAGGAAGGAIGTGLGFLSSRVAYKRAKRMYKHRYQWTMEDMRKAGLNPMLAYRTGVGGGVPAPQQAPIPNLTGVGRDIGSAIAVKNQGETLKSQTSLNEANALKAGQETITSAAQAELLRTQNLLKSKEKPRARMWESFDTEVIEPLFNRLKGALGTARESHDFDALWNKAKKRARSNAEFDKKYGKNRDPSLRGKGSKPRRMISPPQGNQNP